MSNRSTRGHKWNRGCVAPSALGSGAVAANTICNGTFAALVAYQLLQKEQQRLYRLLNTWYASRQQLEGVSGDAELQALYGSGIKALGQHLFVCKEGCEPLILQAQKLCVLCPVGRPCCFIACINTIESSPGVKRQAWTPLSMKEQLTLVRVVAGRLHHTNFQCKQAKHEWQIAVYTLELSTALPRPQRMCKSPATVVMAPSERPCNRESSPLCSRSRCHRSLPEAGRLLYYHQHQVN